MTNHINIGVLASGGGTNLQSIIDNCEAGTIDGDIVVVISDVQDAYCLERARKHGIDAVYVNVPRTGTDGWRDANREITDILCDHNCDLVAMAGYMRMISPHLLDAFPEAVMNIHPALLPSFAGTQGQKDAYDYGVKIAGLTVHFADEEFDRGPVIIQAAVPVLDEDTVDDLKDRILELEHKAYPQAVQWFAQGRLEIRGRRVYLDGSPTTAGNYNIIWPPVEID